MSIEPDNNDFFHYEMIVTNWANVAYLYPIHKQLKSLVIFVDNFVQNNPYYL